MSALKSFEEYQKNGVIRKVTADKERAKSLLRESQRKMSSLKINLAKVGLHNDNANDYVEYCYDTLMLLVRSRMFANGFSSAGQGAHEAEVAYLVILKFSEKEVRFMDQLRYFRNGILYYGKNVDEEYAQKVIAFTKNMHPKLLKLLKF